MRLIFVVAMVFCFAIALLAKLGVFGTDASTWVDGGLLAFGLYVLFGSVNVQWPAVTPHD